MTSSDAKLQKVQTQFEALSAIASSLNTASDELTKVVGILDEALKKLNVGLTVWITFKGGSDEAGDNYDDDQIGYAKVGGKWGLALRNIWGNQSFDDHHEEGPWLFSEAPRQMRIEGVDKIPELIEALGKEAFNTAKQIHVKTEQLRELAGIIEKIAPEQREPQGRK